MRKRRGRRPRAALAGTTLEALVKEATVDAYGDDEQRVGFLTMIENHLALPFQTEIFGVPVKVERVDQNTSGEIVAVCTRGGKRQRIPILDLPLPSPRPKGWEWIEAYRCWAGP